MGIKQFFNNKKEVVFHWHNYLSMPIDDFPVPNEFRYCLKCSRLMFRAWGGRHVAPVYCCYDKVR